MAARVHLEPNDVAAHLAATRLFALLKPDELDQLGRHFRGVQYGPGQYIGRQDQTDGALWIVVAGQVSFDRCRPAKDVQHLGSQGYGAVIGERGVFLGERRPNSVRTVEQTTLLHIDGDTLWAFLRDEPAAFDRLVLPDVVRARLDALVEQKSVAGERQAAVFRRHWTVLARSMVIPAALTGAAAIGAFIVAPLARSPLAILVLASAAIGAPVIAAAWAYFDYHYDCLIITNRRVIHTERTPLVDARRSEAPLTRIQDVQVVIPGLSGRILGFGDVTIQTAGTRGAIRFATAPHPKRIRETVFEMVSRAEDTERREQLAWIATQIRIALGHEPPAAQGDMSEEDGPASPRAQDEPAPWALGPLVSAASAMVAGALPKVRMQHGDEVTWRKHWWILWRRSALLMVTWLAVAAATAFQVTELGAWLGRFLIVTLAALTFALWWQYEDWRNDLYCLTDEHVIDIERRPLGLFEERRQAKLSQIQDIHFVVPHPMAKLLNYGNVMIETAAETGNFTFDFVHDPAGVQEEIFARLDQRRRRAQALDEQRRAQEMTRWLSEYHRITADVRGDSLGPRPLADGAQG